MQILSLKMGIRLHKFDLVLEFSFFPWLDNDVRGWHNGCPMRPNASLGVKKERKKIMVASEGYYNVWYRQSVTADLSSR